MRSVAIIVASAVGFSALLLRAEHAAAQGVNTPAIQCVKCIDDPSPIWPTHWLELPWPFDNVVCGDSNDDGCHIGQWGYGKCEDAHPAACNDPETAALFAYGQKLGWVFTQSQLLELLKRFPKHVTYNAERKAVQVVGCGGEMVGHYPLSRALN